MPRTQWVLYSTFERVIRTQCNFEEVFFDKAKAERLLKHDLSNPTCAYAVIVEENVYA